MIFPQTCPGSQRLWFGVQLIPKRCGRLWVQQFKKKFPPPPPGLNVDTLLHCSCFQLLHGHGGSTAEHLLIQYPPTILNQIQIWWIRGHRSFSRKQGRLLEHHSSHVRYEQGHHPAWTPCSNISWTCYDQWQDISFWSCRWYWPFTAVPCGTKWISGSPSANMSPNTAHSTDIEHLGGGGGCRQALHLACDAWWGARSHRERNLRQYTGFNLNSTRPPLTWSPSYIENGETRILMWQPSEWIYPHCEGQRFRHGADKMCPFHIFTLPMVWPLALYSNQWHVLKDNERFVDSDQAHGPGGQLRQKLVDQVLPALKLLEGHSDHCGRTNFWDTVYYSWIIEVIVTIKNTFVHHFFSFQGTGTTKFGFLVVVQHITIHFIFDS